MKSNLPKKDYLKFRKAVYKIFSKKDLQDRQALTEIVGDINIRKFDSEFSERELDVFEGLLWKEVKRK